MAQPKAGCSSLAAGWPGTPITPPVGGLVETLAVTGSASGKSRESGDRDVASIAQVAKVARCRAR